MKEKIFRWQIKPFDGSIDELFLEVADEIHKGYHITSWESDYQISFRDDAPNVIIRMEKK